MNIQNCKTCKYENQTHYRHPCNTCVRSLGYRHWVGKVDNAGTGCKKPRRPTLSVWGDINGRIPDVFRMPAWPAPLSPINFVSLPGGIRKRAGIDFSTNTTQEETKMLTTGKSLKIDCANNGFMVTHPHYGSPSHVFESFKSLTKYLESQLVPAPAKKAKKKRAKK